MLVGGGGSCRQDGGMISFQLEGCGTAREEYSTVGWVILIYKESYIKDC